MKLLLCGCLHGSVHPRLKSAAKTADAVLCCGDLCDTDTIRDVIFGNLDTIEKIEASLNKKKHDLLVKRSVKTMDGPLKFFRSLRVPVYLVYGNNDYLNRQVKHLNTRGLEDRLPKNVHLLNNRVAVFDGLPIAGFPGYRGMFGKKMNMRLKALMKKIRVPKETLFLTHDVPYRKFDLVTWKKSPALGQHVGEKLFNKMLRKGKFLAFICSHMHEHQGLDSLYGTHIINTGYARSGKFSVIDIKENKITGIKFYK